MIKIGKKLLGIISSAGWTMETIEELQEKYNLYPNGNYLFLQKM